MKFIKQLTTLLFTLLLSIQLNGQKDTHDRIVLKDGSIIVGEIVLYESGKDMRFVLKMNGDTISIKQGDIYKVGFYGEEVTAQKKRKKFDIKKPGATLEFSNILFFSKDYSGKGFRLSYLQAFSPQFNIGLNINLDKFDQEQNVSIIGVSLGYRYYHDFNKIQAYAGVNLGYGFAREGGVFFQVLEKKGGLLAKPYVGVQIGLNHRAAVSFSLGYKYQEAEYTFADYDGDIIYYDWKLRRITLGLNFYTKF